MCDAAEVAGKNVMSTSSTVTTDLVNHRYGSLYNDMVMMPITFTNKLKQLYVVKCFLFRLEFDILF